MSSKQRQASSGSDGSAEIDERKKKRMQSNRESARRSRKRKQQQMEDLTNEISRLQIANNQIQQLIKAREQAFIHIDSENKVLEAQKMELNDRFKSLNSFVDCIEDANRLTVDIPEIPDPLLKPWQIPYQTQPITASADDLFFI
ncbi:hypothetical protein FNV43_RR23633 [Rhamnella rubrinervis]|uniref:BZIP domain-containing protein n=1 Tax=Rhamnella rubrinervis TaxID=2594499 RepID=A0A8K0GT55_9ROSA|nr:hypothetical protein FNV43_RR23633 [Rhamnella rubrinervis]